MIARTKEKRLQMNSIKWNKSVFEGLVIRKDDPA